MVQVIKMLMVVVALFALAWLPLQVYGVLEQMLPQIKWSVSQSPCEDVYFKQGSPAPPKLYR